MKLSEARAICDVIDPVRCSDGQVRCRYLIDEEKMCRLPSKFKCEVVLYVEKKNYWSYSRLALLMKCPTAYKYRYIDGVKPEPKAYHWLGRQFHTAMAKIDLGMDWDLEELPQYVPIVDALKLRALLEVLSKRPSMAGESEKHFQIAIDDGVMFQGFIDWVSRDRKSITERKYAQDASNYHLLTLYYQVGLYLIAEPSVEEVHIEVARKSRIKQGKNESLEAFYERALEECKQNELKLLTRRTYLRREFDLERIRRDLVFLTKLAGQYKEFDTWPLASSQYACSDCDYYGHCRARFGVTEETVNETTMDLH